MDGKTFALARFPPNMQLENQVSQARTGESGTPLGTLTIAVLGLHGSRIDDRFRLPARDDPRRYRERVGHAVQVELERDLLLALARIREPERQRVRRF